MKHELTSIRLREALNDNNLKPQDLANRSGVSKASISQYLSGTFVPSNITSGKLADVLKVSPAWLMGFDVPKYDLDDPDVSEALALYKKYLQANPKIQGRIDALLEFDELKT